RGRPHRPQGRRGHPLTRRPYRRFCGSLANGWPARASRFVLACIGEPVAQFRPAAPLLAAAHRHRERALLPDDDHEALAAGHAGIDQIALQHRVVLRRQRDDHRVVFRALALVDCRRIGERELIELAAAIGDGASIEIGGELAALGIDPGYNTEIAVVNVAVVIVLDLHDLVAGAEDLAEALDAQLARRVQRLLQFEVQGTRAEPAAVHRAQHLDVANGVEAEALRDALFHERQDLAHAVFGVGRLDEIEIAALDRVQLGHLAAIDAMRIGDDTATRRLPENFGEAYDRHGARSDDVGQDLPRADGRQLIDVAHQQ